MALNDPLLLEEVLLRHKRLRVLLMHAGWPFLESTMALLHAHPNVYVDLGALQAASRPAYYRHLRGLVENLLWKTHKEAVEWMWIRHVTLYPSSVSEQYPSHRFH